MLKCAMLVSFESNIPGFVISKSVDVIKSEQPLMDNYKRLLIASYQNVVNAEMDYVRDIMGDMVIIRRSPNELPLNLDALAVRFA